jgi:hypothetical protein
MSAVHKFPIVIFEPWHSEYFYLFQTAFLKTLTLLSTAMITAITVFYNSMLFFTFDDAAVVT